MRQRVSACVTLMVLFASLAGVMPAHGADDNTIDLSADAPGGAGSVDIKLFYFPADTSYVLASTTVYR